MIINAIYELNNPKPRLYPNIRKGSILSFIPKGFFILPIQKYPFMNFWETPFPEKKKVKTMDWKKSKEPMGWDDIGFLFK